MNEEKTYLSKEKFEELKEELEELKTVRRKEIAEKLEYAKSLGDLSENSEYQDARESQANTEERISTRESLLKSAEIVFTHTKDHVDIGSTVTIQKISPGAPEESFQLVGSEESDISQRKISNKSPLGEALFGKEKGDIFLCITPNGKVKYKILEIK